MKLDKTKWYGINYTKLHDQAVQHAPSTSAKSSQEEVRIAPSTEGKLPLAITKENKSIGHARAGERVLARMRA